MGQALYRKYRSKNWSEILGQSHVTKTLDNAIASDKFGHAYLFSGPRGVGKTSVARIFARQINQLSYKDDSSHIDIIEIDAASNTSVEDIRDLREKVSVAPSLAKYKVYIIDEVHMLSKSAFNALLKTLEEPPKHVVFVLATTDPHKLPETIISRVQHFAFRPITTAEATKQLLSIAKSEDITLDQQAAKLIAKLGDGSFRDSLSLLDQLAARGETIDRELVEKLVGLPSTQLVQDVVEAVNQLDPKLVIELLQETETKGYQADVVANRLSEVWRNQAIESNDSRKLALVRSLLDVKASHSPRELLEIILLDAALDHKNQLPQATAPATSYKTTQTPDNPKKTTQPSEPKDAATHFADKTPKENPKQTDEVKPKNPETNSKKITISKDQPNELWRGALEQLRTQYPTLYSIARMGRLSDNNENDLLIEFAYPFHAKRIKQDKNKQIIEKLIHQLAGQPVSISYAINKNIASSTDEEIELNDISTQPASDNPITDEQPPATAKTQDLEAINSIFGDSELLQSG